MKILTAEEMGAADRRSVEAGVPVAELMENAGGAVARLCLRRFAGEGLVVVLAGKGNNGGDGMVAARKMAEAGRLVRVVLLGAAGELKGEVAQVWGLLVGMQAAGLSTAAAKSAASGRDDRVGAGRSDGDCEVVEIGDERGLEAAVDGAALVIDAVVGTGFKPPLRGLAEVTQRMLAEMDVPVVAVDLPSGWNADSMEETAAGAFRADAVVTFVAPKVAHVFGHLTAGKTFGAVAVAGIGEPEGAVESATGLTWTGGVEGDRGEGRGRSMEIRGGWGMCCLWVGRGGRRGRRQWRAWRRCGRVRGW